MFNTNNNHNPYFANNMIEKLYYELEEEKRKNRNLLKRIRKIEDYLNIRFDDELL